jgi:DNA-binding winged helix-turn-helix (wHTH) protein
MTDCYIFGPFQLYPLEHRLVQNGKEISLEKRGFDLLVALVSQHPHLVSKEVLIDMIWKKEGKEVTVEEGNLNTQISRLRKSLADDRSDPHYIETVRGVGYRFKAPVTRVPAQVPLNVQRHAEYKEQSFDIESHCFVPTYIGNLGERGIEHSTLWGKFSIFHFQDMNASLHVSEYGIGVWDIRDMMRFTCITDLALWRRGCFQTILLEQHQIIEHTKKLLPHPESILNKTLYRYAGVPKYVLSVFVLKHHNWPAEQLRSALKLMSCPRVLLQDGDKNFDRNQGLIREQRILESGFEHPDLREFGIFGSDFGYAGWAGVSYCSFPNGPSQLWSTIADYELALQSLWLFCHLIKNIADQADKNQTQALRAAESTIHRELARLRAIGPTESTEERTMCEAIFATSRIQRHSAATLDSIARVLR